MGSAIATANGDPSIRPPPRGIVIALAALSALGAFCLVFLGLWSLLPIAAIPLAAAGVFYLRTGPFGSMAGITRLGLAILATGLVLLSWGALQFVSIPFGRPIQLQLGFVAIGAGLFLMAVRYPRVTIVGALIAGLALRTAIFWSYPTYLGNDIRLHAAIVAPIVTTGFIPTTSVFGKSVDFPAFHVAIASAAILLGVKIRTAIYFEVIIGGLGAGLGVSLITMKLFRNWSVAAVAVVLWSFLDIVVQRSAYAITNESLLQVLVVLGVYLFLQSLGPRSGILFLILASTVILGHQLSPVTLLMFCAAVAIGAMVLRPNGGAPSARPVIFLVAGSIMMLLWTNSEFGFDHSQVGVLVSLIAAKLSHTQVSSLTPRIGYLDYLRNFRLQDAVALQGGMILTALATAAGLLTISWRARTPRSLYGLSYILFGTGVAVVIIALGIVPTRWLFWVVLLSLPIAAWTLARSAWSLMGLPSVLALIAVVIAFAIVANPVVNGESPIYGSGLASRQAFTIQEERGAFTIIEHSPHTVGISADALFHPAFKDHAETLASYPEIEAQLRILSPSNSTQMQTLIVTRSAMFHEPVAVGSSDEVIAYQKVPFDRWTFTSQIAILDRWYDNGDVTTYFR